MQFNHLIKFSNQIIQNKITELPWPQLQINLFEDIKYLQFLKNIAAPVNHYQFQAQYKQLMKHFTSQKQRKLYQCVRIKLYCQMIAAFIESNNLLEGRKFINKLLSLLQSKQDVERAIYFSFKIRSLAVLGNYQVSRNKQYKYDLVTQTLFYYILSLVKPHAKEQLTQNFIKLYNKIKQTDINNKLLTAINQQIEHKPSSSLVKELVFQLLNKQIQLSKQSAHINNSQSDEKITTQLYRVIDERIQKNEKFNRILDLIRKIRNTEYQTMLIEDMSETSLVKKLLRQRKFQVIPQISPEEKFSRYKQIMQMRGGGSIVTFKRCEAGMSMLKYNYGNEVVGWRFVRIGEDGIFYGKDSEQCPLKYQWKDVLSIAYGKVSPNIIEKCKYISQNRIFSLILKQRSVDFVCQNQEQVIAWLQGIAYILNKNWQASFAKARRGQTKKASFSKGNIYWKSLFMKIGVEGKGLTNKSTGIIHKASAVKHLLEEKKQPQKQ